MVNCFSQDLIQIGQRIKIGSQNLTFENKPDFESRNELFDMNIDFKSLATETVFKI